MMPQMLETTLPSPAGRTYAVRLAALNFGLQYVWGALLAVSFPLRAIEVGGTQILGSYAVLAASGAALAAATQIIFGTWADARRARIGHRREFYVAGILCALPLLWLFYTAQSFALLACAFYGLQLSLNIAGGPYQAAISDHIDASGREAASAWMSAMQSAGAAAGLLVAAFVHGQAQTGAALIAGLIVAGAVTFAAARERPDFRAAGSDRQAGTAYAAQSETTIASSDSSSTIPRIGSAVRTLITLAISRGLINIGFYTLLGFLAFYVRESLHVDGADPQRTTTALIFLAFTIAAAAGAFATAKPAARFDKRTVICVTGAIIVAAVAALFGVTGLRPAFGAAIIAGFAWGGFVTVDWALACALLPSEAMGAAMGWWNLANVIPQILAPLIAAPIITHFNAVEAGLGARAVMLFAAAAFLCGSLAIWAVPAKLAGRGELLTEGPSA